MSTYYVAQLVITTMCVSLFLLVSPLSLRLWMDDKPIYGRYTCSFYRRVNLLLDASSESERVQQCGATVNRIISVGFTHKIYFGFCFSKPQFLSILVYLLCCEKGLASYSAIFTGIGGNLPSALMFDILQSE